MTDTYPIWFNGELRDAKDCTVHVLSHALHYGSSVFEGIRPEPPFRLKITWRPAVFSRCSPHPWSTATKS
jgi:hypothetical protein